LLEPGKSASGADGGGLKSATGQSIAPQDRGAAAVDPAI
jgi:hypothetical protein